MGLRKGHNTRPTPEGWRALQGRVVDLPVEVVWPEDQCSRCKIVGQMTFDTGKSLCADCAENTVVQTASPLGLHERAQALELQS